MVSGLAEGGPYDGFRIERLGSSRSLRRFPDVDVVCSSGPDYNYDEASRYMEVVVVGLLPRVVVIGASLLQEGA